MPAPYSVRFVGNWHCLFPVRLSFQKRKAFNMDEKTKKAIGRRFREFRETIGMKRIDMAKLCKVSQSLISNFENGRAILHTKYLIILNRELRLNIHWLFGGQGPMHLKDKETREKYSELEQLLNVPEVEQVLLAKLIEAKEIFHDEIEAFSSSANSKKQEK
jgi:transcriptional regulator with XRE-family HTH domain